jgi:hypothetical protein
VVVEMLGRAHEPGIREYTGNLRALVARLRDDRPVDIQGAAMTARLVNDRSSPLYREHAEGLGSAVLSARLALDRSAATQRDLASAA